MKKMLIEFRDHCHYTDNYRGAALVGFMWDKVLYVKRYLM